MHRHLIFVATFVFATIIGHDPSSAQPASTAKIENVLLDNGELLTGTAGRQLDTIVVTTDRGAIIRVPDRRVLYVGATADDVFRFLQRSANLQRVEEVVQLAKWALENQLYEQCQAELIRAAELDPDHEDARVVRERLAFAQDRQSHASSTRTNAQPTTKPRPALSRTEQQPPIVPHSYNDLSPLERAQLANFTRHAQPLVLNQCATAGCHGRAATNDYRLLIPPRGMGITSRQSIANMRATLQFVDQHRPGSSRLLTAVRENDAHLNLFLSEQGDTALARLTQWVAALAPPGTSEQVTKESAPPKMEYEAASIATVDGATHSPPGKAHPREDTTIQQTTAVASQPAGDNAHDPYDPAPFNQAAQLRGQGIDAAGASDPPDSDERSR